jgi:hypothetical protein
MTGPGFHLETPPRLLADDRAAVPLAFPSSQGLGSLAELLDEDDALGRGGGMVCPCCQGLAKRVVRARPGGAGGGAGGRAGGWVAVCAICAGRLLAGHPGTVVGGRVKPRLRRAG